MEVEFKKGAFSYFLLAGLVNNCTVYQRLSAKGWVEWRRNAVSDCQIASGHVAKQNLPSVWHTSLDCWHVFLGLGLEVDTLQPERANQRLV